MMMRAGIVTTDWILYWIQQKNNSTMTSIKVNSQLSKWRTSTRHLREIAMAIFCWQL